MSRHRELVLLGILLCFFLGMVVTAGMKKSATSDEWHHYDYAMRVGIEQSFYPDTRVLMPISVLSYWSVRLGQVISPQGFTDSQSNIPSLFWGRLPIALFASLLMVAVWGVCRTLGGPEVGLLGLWFGITSPLIIAHAEWITLDIPATCTFFLAISLSVRALLRRTTIAGVSATVCVGIAELAKLSNLLLFIFVPLMVFADYLIEWRRLKKCPPLMRVSYGLLLLLGMILVSWLILCCVYGLSITSTAHLSDNVTVPSLLAHLLPSEFLQVYKNAQNVAAGQWGYFRGQTQTAGWLSFFPVALLIKNPLPTILLVTLSLVWLLRRPTKLDLWDIALLVIPVMDILYFVLFIKVNIGVRYLLPICPPLICFGARLYARTNRSFVKVLLCSLALWNTVEATRAYPDYIPYFNQLVGGQTNAYMWLVDSDLDWRQDVVIEQHLRNEGFPEDHINPEHPVAGRIVFAVRELVSIWGPPETVRWRQWLREECEPVSFITPTLPVFNVPFDFASRVPREDRPPRRTEWMDPWLRRRVGCL